MKVSRFLLTVLLGFTTIVSAQKPQRVGYVDMNYILENVPEYRNAQAQLDTKVKNWQEKLDGLSAEIEQLKTDLSNEKPLLTNELIKEREEDIDIKEQELRRLQQAYFGPTGDLFQLRKQLATPVQDQVYNAIQEIAKAKRYDFVLDKSSDLIMLYSNPKFDISELVLNRIVRNRKRQAIEDVKKERIAKAGVVTPPTVLEGEDEADGEAYEAEDQTSGDATAASTGTVDSEVTEEPEAQQATVEKTEEQKKLEERIRKREELKARIKAQQEARAKMRDSLKRVAEERRAAKLKEIEDRKKQREEAIQNKD